ncbi:MAG: MliC family protein [Steroidobacteraceae bacterium]
MHRLHALRALALLTVAAALPAAPSFAAGDTEPSYSCAKVEKGSVEALVCSDAGLSALDRKLAGVYAEATRKAANEHPPVLAATQRGWIKGRDDCWKDKDVHACVADAYTMRIVELQARYRLVAQTGPVTFACDGDPRNELVVTYFKTDPASMIAERGDETSLMIQQVAASGARYQGRNESFWEHQGVATVVWGYEAKPMQCRPQPAAGQRP